MAGTARANRLPAWVRAITGPDTLVGAAFGWIAWSSAFVLLYALLSLGCMFGWNEGSIGGANRLTVLLAATWITHLIAIAALLALTWRVSPQADDGGTGSRRFLAFATRLGYAASLVATAWLGFPILMLSPCA
jgi:hypothetical protein